MVNNENHKTCTQAWVYPHEPVPALLGEVTVTSVPSVHRWLQIVTLTIHHFYNINGTTDLAIGTGSSHDCETTASFVIRKQYTIGLNCNQHRIICNAKQFQ